MKEKENPFVNNIILLIFAQSFNDWWSIVFGMPTPIQLALLYGIVSNLKQMKSLNNHYVRNIKKYISIYILVLFIYIFAGMLLDLAWLNGLSILINMIWLITTLPHLANGISEKNWIKIKNNILKIVGLITIPTGFYEFFTQTNILPTDVGLSELTFYLRGLHIDKLEFASYLCLAFFISLTDWLISAKKINLARRFFNIYIFMSTIFLIIFSFSSTAILGFILGTIAILYYSKKITLPLLLVFLIIPFGYFIIQSQIFENLNKAYILKYELNVENIEIKNFRYVALEKSFEGFKERPFFGHGIGQSGEVIKELLGIDKPINPHNIISNELLDYGVVGFFFLFVLIVKIVAISFKKHHFKSVYLKQIDLIVKALSILILFRFLLYYHRFDQTIYFLWMVLAILSFTANQQRAKQNITL